MAVSSSPSPQVERTYFVGRLLEEVGQCFSGMQASWARRARPPAGKNCMVEWLILQVTKDEEGTCMCFHVK